MASARRQEVVRALGLEASAQKELGPPKQTPAVSDALPGLPLRPSLLEPWFSDAHCDYWTRRRREGMMALMDLGVKVCDGSSLVGALLALLALLAMPTIGLVDGVLTMSVR